MSRIPQQLSSMLAPPFFLKNPLPHAVLLKACGAHRCIFDVVIVAPSADKKGDSRCRSCAKAWRRVVAFRVPKKGKVENPFEKKTCHPKGLCAFFKKKTCHQKGLCVFLLFEGGSSHVRARSYMCSLKRINSTSEVVNA